MAIDAIFPNSAQMDENNSQLSNIHADLQVIGTNTAYIKSIVEALTSGSGDHSDDDIATIRRNVQLGLGPDYYPVGTIITIPENPTVSIAYHGSLTGAEVVAHTFTEAIGNIKSAVYELIYDGLVWHMDGVNINPAVYGITISGTPVENDEIAVTVTSTEVEWVVLGHNGYDVTPAVPHMTIGKVPCVYNRPFDGAEAFLSVDANGLAAGTYTFNIPQTFGSWEAGDYTFTLTQSYTEGNQLAISGNYGTAITSLSVRTYSDGANATAIETAAITAGNTGTSLGSFGSGLNQTQRVSYGSGNYAQSNIRQRLNSAAAPGEWYTQTTIYDRISSTYNNLGGFLYYMGKDFRESLVSTTLTCATNTIFETGYQTGSSYTVNDKVFLLSMTELNFGNNNGVAENTLLPYYTGATNTDRIKYDQNALSTARTWWMRSVYPSYANCARGVNTSGALNSHYAVNGRGEAPACNIG